MQLLTGLIVLGVVMVGVNKLLGQPAPLATEVPPSYINGARVVAAGALPTTTKQDVTLPPYSPARLGGVQ